MHDYGIWTIITPLVTIILAILTRQVILSLLTGIFVGYAVINHSIIQGVGATLNGIIETFASAGNARTIVFMVMIGGIMRLIVVYRELDKPADRRGIDEKPCPTL